MEANITRQKEYAQTIDRKLAKYEVKRKQMIESQRQLKQDVSDDEQLRNQDLMDIDDEESGADGNSDPEPEPLLELMEGKDNESEGHSSDESAKGFVNPLAPKKSKKVEGEVSEGEWSDESEGNGKKKSKT